MRIFPLFCNQFLSRLIYYIRQRMYKYEHYLDFPLQPSHSRQNPLNSYIPDNKQKIFQLPRQLSTSPFMPNNHHKAKLPTQSNHSISKFAFTQTSTQDPKQDDQILPFCQNFFNEKQIIFDSQGTAQQVTEATFKPNQLKKQLQQIKDSKNYLRRLLSENLLRKQDKNTKVRNITTVRCNSKTKTKYQKILEQFFCKKDNKESVKRKVSVQKVQNYKLKFRDDEKLPQKNRNYPDFDLQRPQNRNFKEIISSLNIKQPQVIINLEEKNNKLLRKTFSTQELAQDSNRLNRQISVKSILEKRKEIEEKADNQKRERKESKQAESWLRLTFHQRQARSLQKRKQKQNLGKQLNLKKEVENCTFKPIKTDFRIKKQQNTATSYAKRYYQKLKRL